MAPGVDVGSVEGAYLGVVVAEEAGVALEVGVEGDVVLDLVPGWKEGEEVEEEEMKGRGGGY